MAKGTHAAASSSVRVVLEVAFVAAIVSMTTATAEAGQRQSNRETLGAVAGVLQKQADALGLRVKTPGAERTQLLGEWTGADGNKRPLRVEYQLSGLVRVNSPGSTDITFDGDQTRDVTNRADSGLLESFVSDLPESMLRSVRDGAAVRLLGTHFAAEGAQDSVGVHYDIYEVLAPERTRPDSPILLKRYSFDSDTALLAATRYVDASTQPETEIETRFSNWGQLHGSAFPARVERFENGRRVFLFEIQAIASGPALSPASYR